MRSEWEYTTLGECAHWYSGGTPRKSCPQYWDGDIPWISAKSLKDFQIRDSEDRVTSEGLENGTRLVPAEAILFVVRGMSLKSEFRLGVTQRPVSFNQDLKAIVAKDGYLPYFLVYILKGKSAEILDLVEEAGHGTGVLPTGLIKNIKIPAISKEEQERLIQIFRAIDDKIEMNRRMNATLEGMAQALFKSWFVDFDPVIDNALTAGNPIPDELADRAEVRRQALANGTANREAAKPFPAAFQQTESMGWIPEEWEVKTIGDLCVKIQNGGTPKRDNEEFWNNGTIPWLTSGEVRQSVILSVKNTITEYGLANSSTKWLPARSTVVAMYGATAGQVAFIHNKLTTNQAVCGLVPKDHFQYFNYLLIEGNVKHFENQARGSAQQNISKGIIEESAAIIPPMHAAQSFEGLAHPMFEKWAKNMETNDQLSKLRDTLLPKLISGELRVPNLEAPAHEIPA